MILSNKEQSFLVENFESPYISVAISVLGLIKSGRFNNINFENDKCFKSSYWVNVYALSGVLLNLFFQRTEKKADYEEMLLKYNISSIDIVIFIQACNFVRDYCDVDYCMMHVVNHEVEKMVTNIAIISANSN